MAPAAAIRYSASRPPALEVRNLSVEFRSAGNRVEAVNRVSFNIAKGEIVALVGELGSGKSASRRSSILKLLPLPRRKPSDGAKSATAGRTCSRPTSTPCARFVATSISMIFQEPMTSLNPLHSIP